MLHNIYPGKIFVAAPSTLSQTEILISLKRTLKRLWLAS